MRVDNSSSANPAPVAQAVGRSGMRAADLKTESTVKRPDGETYVSAAGRETMLRRLFGVASGDTEPGVQPPGPVPGVISIYQYLTVEDRETIAAAYDYARSTGTDPRQVDALAVDLGHYRAFPNLVDNVGKLFDENGEPVIYDFSAEDEATAQRVLTSKALTSSALPTDFLRRVLDPGLSPVHASSLSFLEAFTYASATTGSDGSTDPSATPPVRPRERLAALNLPASAPQSGDAGGAASSTTFPASGSTYAPALTATDRKVLAALADSKQEGALVVLAAGAAPKNRFAAVRTGPEVAPTFPIGSEEIANRWGSAVSVQFVAGADGGVNYRGFTAAFADHVTDSMREFVISETGSWLDQHLAGD